MERWEMRLASWWLVSSRDERFLPTKTSQTVDIETITLKRA